VALVQVLVFQNRAVLAHQQQHQPLDRLDLHIQVLEYQPLARVVIRLDQELVADIDQVQAALRGLV
jgi:hypothetical protein